MQPSLFHLAGDDRSTTIIDNHDGRVDYIPHFLSSGESGRLFGMLVGQIEWKQESLNLFGRSVPFPRMTAWFDLLQRSYRFSGITVLSQQPPHFVCDLFALLEQRTGITFNSVLLNYYRDGNDGISWHTDAEESLGINPTVASLSLGATRKFMLKHVASKEHKKIFLEDGSLLLMRDAMMHNWLHQIPKERRVVGPRINLTFRQFQCG